MNKSCGKQTLSTRNDNDIFHWTNSSMVSTLNRFGVCFKTRSFTSYYNTKYIHQTDIDDSMEKTYDGLLLTVNTVWLQQLFFI